MQLILLLRFVKRRRGCADGDPTCLSYLLYSSNLVKNRIIEEGTFFLPLQIANLIPVFLIWRQRGLAGVDGNDNNHCQPTCWRNHRTESYFIFSPSCSSSTYFSMHEHLFHWNKGSNYINGISNYTSSVALCTKFVTKTNTAEGNLLIFPFLPSVFFFPFLFFSPYQLALD